MCTPEGCADLQLTSVGILMQTQYETQPKVNTPPLHAEYLCDMQTFSFPSLSFLFPFPLPCLVLPCLFSIFFMGAHHRSEIGSLIGGLGGHTGSMNLPGQTVCSAEHNKPSGVRRLNYHLCCIIYCLKLNRKITCGC